MKTTSVVRLFLILTLGIALDAYAVSAADFDQESFIAKNIETSADTGNYVDSKKVALISGTSEALFTVLKRIVMAKEESKLENIVKGDHYKLVSRYEVLKERITSHSYSATINVVFDRNAVKELLIDNGILFNDKLYEECLIIPFTVEEKRNWAWNTWNQPELYRLGMVSPVIIENGLDEVDNLDFHNIMDKPYQFFNPLMLKYAANDILLVGVVLDGFRSFIRLKLLTSEGKLYYRNMTYEATIVEDSQDLEKRIISDILKILDDWWKGDKKVLRESSGTEL